ncbi:hypothetical protein [Marivivens sp. JLT3646]|uniref:hypothetical protein n=1 Tax=Marivivens sp. JLT3646 TaxID=1920883 RepID=UPI0007FF5F4F|nr:hypothetical protein [Marivivens sp. JLT3646]APO87918.1 hypothetical protein BSK21_13370 [Marivivens sp. JLT3646]OBR38649.1 hypothetical protein A9199_13660 [Donghicola sp. JL3646]
MFKTVTAGLTALSLALSVPTTAQAGNDDVAKALAGLAMIAIVGAALSDNNGRAQVQVTPPQTYPNRREGARGHDDHRRDNWGHNARRVSPLPEACSIELNRRGETRELYNSRCLRRTYANFDALPSDCQTTYRRNGHTRNGYNASCLRQYGFREERR